MGTPNITGTWSGTGRILIRASSPPNLFGQTAASSDCGVDWTFNFAGLCQGCGTMTLTEPFMAGSLFPGQITPMTTPIPYTITAPGGGSTVPIIDNGDGTYTVRYTMTVFPNAPQEAQEDTQIRLEITKLHDASSNLTKLAIVTVPDFYRTIPGQPLTTTTPPPPSFFLNATPDWAGCAEFVPQP